VELVLLDELLVVGAGAETTVVGSVASTAMEISLDANIQPAGRTRGRTV